MTRNEKAEIISNLEAEFKASEAIVVCDYRGLSVKKLEALRIAAKEQNVKVQVIKNTLAKIALSNCAKDGMELKDTNIFGEINDFLTSKGIEPINWSLGKIRK